jgi:hypothetical protein
LSPARQGFPLIGINYWDSIIDDRSFVLTGIEIPEPAGFAMLLAGCGLLGCRRRTP